jgi:hypothetical protein
MKKLVVAERNRYMLAVARVPFIGRARRSAALHEGGIEG